MIKAIEPLGKHDRTGFSCGVAALDDWFHARAGQDEKRNVARVFVAVDDQRRIVGFYSLSSFTLAITDLPHEFAKRLPRYDLIPAALIGRLARDERVRGEGVGDLLLADAVRRNIGTLRSLAAFAIGASNEEAASAILDSIHFRPGRLGLFIPEAAEAATPVHFPISQISYLSVIIHRYGCIIGVYNIHFTTHGITVVAIRYRC